MRQNAAAVSVQVAMKHATTVILAFCLGLAHAAELQRIPVFPAASGVGMCASGGRGGSVLGGSATIPARKASALIELKLLTDAAGDKTFVLTIEGNAPDYHVGCPSSSLVVIRSTAN